MAKRALRHRPGMVALAAVGAAVVVVAGVVTVKAVTGGTATPQASPAATAPPASSAASPSASAGSTTSAPPPVIGSLSGTWFGIWKNTTPDNSTGSFVIHWNQSGSTLAGTISIANTPCTGGGKITGHLEGDRITFGKVGSAEGIGFSGVVSGRSMRGTYQSSTVCGNAKGTWRARKSG